MTPATSPPFNERKVEGIATEELVTIAEMQLE